MRMIVLSLNRQEHAVRKYALRYGIVTMIAIIYAHIIYGVEKNAILSNPHTRSYHTYSSDWELGVKINREK